MSPKSLFNLIQRLSEDEVLLLREWIKQHTRVGKKKPKYLFLLDRMLKLDGYDQDKLRVKPFNDPATFYRSRELLLEKVVLCFSDQETPVLNNWTYIKTAVRFGAFDIAQKFFEKEYHQVGDNGKLDHILVLARYRDHIERLLEVDLGEKLDLQPAGKYLEILLEEERAIGLIEATRKALRQDESTRIELVEEINEFLKDRFNSEGYWKWKLRIARELLTYSIPLAAKFQSEMVERIVSGEIQLDIALKIREISNAVNLSLQVRNRELAT